MLNEYGVENLLAICSDSGDFEPEDYLVGNAITTMRKLIRLSLGMARKQHL